MSRYGKIARLPRNIRDELNRRLDNGWMGARFVEWLNGLPEVKDVLKTDFESREISEQNLSDWKANGYLHWQAQQETLALARELNTNATELTASGGELSDSLARLVTARYAALLYDSNGDINDETRAKLRGLRGLSREVVRLRRSDQFIERMKIQREWLDWDQKKTKAANRGKVHGAALNQRRYEDAKREDETKALQICLDEAKKFPEAQALFRQAFQELKKAQDAE